MADELERLNEALDKLVAAEPSALADGAAIVALHHSLARLEAVLVRSVGAFDASRAFEDDGACSAAAWMAATCHVPQPTARRRVRLGRGLRHLPFVAEAFLAGDIGEAQAELMVGARTPVTEEALGRDEEMLVEKAKALRFSSFSKVMQHWRYCADPDGEEDKAERDHDSRRLHLSQSFGGMWFGNLVLDPISGDIVSGELSRIEKEMFRSDWLDARKRLGEEFDVADLGRTPAQRRADALVEMARRSATAPADGKRPEPLFTVLVGYETLAGRICELASGAPVSPGSLTRWLDRAWVERVVFEGPSRVIDVGSATRLFSGATRRAVQVRDRECFHEYCEEPAQDCEVDHVKPWAAGGPTTADNGRVACGFHNRHRGRGP